MSVFTVVSEDQARAWLKHYTIGHLSLLEGIAAGIENTNYFLTTTHGGYVLTLFEKLTPDELPYYVNLMAHLAHHGIACPLPIERVDGEYISVLNGKPACIVTRLAGRPVETPGAAHCAAVGELLAEMHLAGGSYRRRMENWRGKAWWGKFVPQVQPLLNAEDAGLVADELRFQRSRDYTALPQGVIHGDLFRDNILFVGNRIGGVIDFYFAGSDTWLFDLAVTVNDWSMALPGELDPERLSAILDAYCALCPVTDLEKQLWPAMLRSAALRFWLSRLYDFYLPRQGEIIKAHDPAHFQKILQGHARETVTWPL